MFNLDIDFDFDEDFSPNIFSKKVSTDEIENEKIKKNEIVSKKKISEPFNEFNKQSKEERKSENLLNCELFGENSLKRPLREEEKPQKKRLSHEGLLQRRFPGPAGLLPDKPLKEISEVSLLLEKKISERESESESESESGERGKEKCVLYSQCSGSVFVGSAYEQLCSDFSLSERGSPLRRYSVEWVRRVCVGKGVQGVQGRKVPFLGVVVHGVDRRAPDPVLVLRDPTGEMSGSVHREVWAEMGGKLKAGVALALRQVGVLMTGVIRRQIYLNITMNNILAIYSSSENKSEVEVTTVNKASKAELLSNLSEWLAPARASSPRAPPPPSFPFTTIDDQRKKLSTKNNEVVNFGNREESEILNDFGIDLSDSDFSEEMGIPGSGGKGSGGSELRKTSGQVLSPDESQIFEEVLSGINLDEFEM